MIEGYWTCLLCVMVLILLATGWKNELQKLLQVKYMMFIMLLIWISYMMHWNSTFIVSGYSITIDGSVVMTCVVGFITLIKRKYSKEWLFSVILYATLFSFLWAIVTAIRLISPWAEANIVTWYIPMISGIIIGLFELQLNMLIPIIILGGIGAELIVFIQQKGKYVAQLGSLAWWDMLSLTALFGILFILFFKMLGVIGRNLIDFVAKRTKS